jgi:hypothetical protein
MKRKFQHYTIQTILIALSTLTVVGLLNIIYHISFNDPTITFGGW